MAAATWSQSAAVMVSGHRGAGREVEELGADEIPAAGLEEIGVVAEIGDRGLIDGHGAPVDPRRLGRADGPRIWCPLYEPPSTRRAKA